MVSRTRPDSHDGACGQCPADRPLPVQQSINWQALAFGAAGKFAARAMTAGHEGVEIMGSIGIRRFAGDLLGLVSGLARLSVEQSGNESLSHNRRRRRRANPVCAPERVGQSALGRPARIC